MKTWKRILLFVLTNIAIIVAINVIVYVLAYFLGRDLSMIYSDYYWLFIIAACWGFGGAWISLKSSKWMAKKLYKIHVVNDNEELLRDKKIKIVYQTVESIARSNNINMPEVGVYDSPDPNAFATGPAKNKALVAVSTGLLKEMEENEIKWVIWHEMAHVINGDMITMTLLQWVINTFVIFLARVIALGIDIAMRDDNGRGLWLLWYYLIVTLLDILLGFAGMLVLMWYSRHREYRADAWSSRFMGKQNMIDALEKLKIITKDMKVKKDEVRMLKISDGKRMIQLFSSHPTLDQRIEHLKKNY